jgi:hypothetical protein
LDYIIVALPQAIVVMNLKYHLGTNLSPEIKDWGKRRALNIVTLGSFPHINIT